MVQQGKDDKVARTSAQGGKSTDVFDTSVCLVIRSIWGDWETVTCLCRSVNCYYHNFDDL